MLVNEQDRANATALLVAIIGRAKLDVLLMKPGSPTSIEAIWERLLTMVTKNLD